MSSEEVRNQLIQYADTAYEEAMRSESFSSDSLIQDILNKYDTPVQWYPDHYYSPYSRVAKKSMRLWVRAWTDLPPEWNAHMEKVGDRASIIFRRLTTSITEEISKNDSLHEFDAISNNGYICKSGTFLVRLGDEYRNLPMQRVYLAE